MLIARYLVFAFLLLLFAYVVFRVIVRADYLRKGKLSFISIILETLMFALHANFMYVYIPVRWPQFPPALPSVH